jgi:hypothetical protein
VFHRGERLEHVTIVSNCLEGLVSIVVGVIAGSGSLVGFGLDSVIRPHHNLDLSRHEQVERATLRMVGALLTSPFKTLRTNPNESVFSRNTLARS